MLFQFQIGYIGLNDIYSIFSTYDQTEVEPRTVSYRPLPIFQDLKLPYTVLVKKALVGLLVQGNKKYYVWTNRDFLSSQLATYPFSSSAQIGQPYQPGGVSSPDNENQFGPA